MNAPHSPSPLASLELAPGDPILGVTEVFVADKNPNKVNLGVGVYYDDNGKVPLLECVREVESERSASGRPWPYLPIDGPGRCTTRPCRRSYSAPTAPR
jgi:aromatic-amino-acid transaminase